VTEGLNLTIVAPKMEIDLFARSTYIEDQNDGLTGVDDMPVNRADDHEKRNRDERLAFRLDEDTKDLIERAARLSRRKVSDFCLTALTDVARRTIAEHETLVLSDRDRDVFFDALINPPEPSERLVRALADHKRRIAR
jgi:uncharacterized protein (DUF1778 family)